MKPIYLTPRLAIATLSNHTDAVHLYSSEGYGYLGRLHTMETRGDKGQEIHHKCSYGLSII